MPTNDPRQPLLQFLASVSDLSGKTEEELIRILLEAKHYKDLQDVLQTHMDEIVTALKTKDVPRLQLALQQTFFTVKQKISSLPDQVATPIEKALPEILEEPALLIQKSQQIQTVLQESPQLLNTLKKSRGNTKRAYIEKLVKNYSKWTPEQSSFIQQTTENIITKAQESPSKSIDQIIKESVAQTFPSKDTLVAKLQKDSSLKREIKIIQGETPKEVSSSFVEALISSPDPVFFKNAFIQSAETASSLQTALEQTKKLSYAKELLQSVPQQDIDYGGIFTKLSTSSPIIEKLFAPAADIAFSLFPKGTQEEIVTKIFGSSWTKEVSNNSFLEKILGPSLQSPSIQSAIQKGNQLFIPSGQKNIVFSKTQTFFVDIFVTIFHPEVSETYLRLAALNNTQMNKSVGQFYLGLLADKGATYATKKGAKAAGKIAAEKAAGSTLGKFIGTLLGGEGGPVGSFIGAILFDKIIGGLWSGVKRGFNFITLGWLGNLISGNYESTPLTKDPIFIISAVLVCSIALLFVIPLTPFTLAGNSFFQQTSYDNAFIPGMGGVLPNGPSGATGPPGINTGAGFACAWSGATPPKTSISYCPVHAPITQGPFTTVGSHIGVDAYDFGCSDGTPIHASQDGYVTSLVTTFQPNEFKDRSFGNNVVLVGTDTSGQIFCTIYAHLLDASPAVIGAYQNKTIIRAGEVIGFSDTTGYTYGRLGIGKGPHLHFGYKGSGRLTLPAGCP